MQKSRKRKKRGKKKVHYVSSMYYMRRDLDEKKPASYSWLVPDELSRVVKIFLLYLLGTVVLPSTLKGQGCLEIPSACKSGWGEPPAFAFMV